jgi:hypothetical protein
MTIRNLLAGLMALGLMVSSVNAAPLWRITEAYAGLSGPDGTADWFEITNFGDMPGDTGLLSYDDDSQSPLSSTPLPSFILGPLESAVFLLDDGANVIPNFRAIWGGTFPVGQLDGAGLSNEAADGVTLFDENFDILDTLNYTAAQIGSIGNLQTFDRSSGAGDPTLSVLGVNGAYESATFDNPNFGGTSVNLIGSPGRVPEPSTLALAAIGLVAAGYGLRRK